jgi:hypothetical protein
MGLFSKKPVVDPRELEALRHEFGDLRRRLEVSEQARADLEAHLTQLDAANAALTARSQTIDDLNLRLREVDALKRQVAQIDVVTNKVQALDSLNGKIAELAERVSLTSADARHAREETVALQQRISNVTTELANQLGELGSEIDALANGRAESASKPDEVVVVEQVIAPEVLDELKTAQVRLANEQARYEIAFREDLATLAEQLKRARSADH